MGKNNLIDYASFFVKFGIYYYNDISMCDCTFYFGTFARNENLAIREYDRNKLFLTLRIFGKKKKKKAFSIHNAIYYSDIASYAFVYIILAFGMSTHLIIT